MRTEMATGAFTKGIETVSKVGRGLFIEFMKVYLLGMGVIAAGVGALLLSSFLLGGASWASVAVMVAAILAMAIIATGIMTVPMNIINEKLSRVPVLGILGNSRRNLLPAVVFYAIMMVVIVLFGYAPLFAAIEMGGAAFIAGYLYYYAFVFLFSFLVQFSLFELVVARSGVLGSFGKSFDIVRKSFWETIIYYIGMFAVSMAAGLALLIAGAVLFLIPAAIGFVVAGAANSQVLNMALLALGVLYAAALYIAYLAGIQAAVLPIQYHYWKAAREVR